MQDMLVTWAHLPRAWDGRAVLGRQPAWQRAFLAHSELPAPVAVNVDQRDGLPVASDPQAGLPSWLLGGVLPTSV